MCGGTQRTSQRSGVKHSKKPPTSWRQEARRRAVTGIDKPVFFKGEVVGSITKYSDSLLMFLLKAHRPQKFRDCGKVKHTGATDVGVDKDIEKSILEKLDRMIERPDDEANE